MMTFSKRKRLPFAFRLLCSIFALIFSAGIITPPTPVSAQSVPLSTLNLPSPGAMVSLTQIFNPPLVRGITVYPDNPLKFNFLISPGDDNLEGNAFREESTRMIKYFLAGLTVPDNELWVNLSPYEQDRIISEKFGQTEMGRDMLAQDYMLKQLSASLMYPENDLGEKFWDRVRQQAYEKYGTTEIPVNTFNKIWIVPSKAVVYEHGQTAFVVESHLKVMLEEDYIALQNNLGEARLGLDQFPQDKAEIISGVTSQVVKEILIPEIEKEVNTGKMFIQLRQIYNSIILATWYKDNLQESLIGKVYVDKGKTRGVDVSDPRVNQQIYEQYLEAFKTGVYNYIKEDYDPATNRMIPRKYFSGGNNFGDTKYLRQDVESLTPDQTQTIHGPVQNVAVNLYAENPINTRQIAYTKEQLRENQQMPQSLPAVQSNSSPVTINHKILSDIKNALQTGGFQNGSNFTLEEISNLTGYNVMRIGIALLTSDDYKQTDQPGQWQINWNAKTASSPIALQQTHAQLQGQAEQSPAFKLDDEWVIESSREIGNARYSVLKSVYIAGHRYATFYTAINKQTGEPVGLGYVLDPYRSNKTRSVIIKELLDKAGVSSSPVMALEKTAIHNFIKPYTLQELIHKMEEINPAHVDLKSAGSLMISFNSGNKEKTIINLAYWLPQLSWKTLDSIRTDVSQRIDELNDSLLNIKNTRYLTDDIKLLQSTVFQNELQELNYLAKALRKFDARSRQVSSSPVKFSEKLLTTLSNMEVPKSDIKLHNEGDADYADPEIDKYTLSATFRLYAKVGNEHVSQVRHSVFVKNIDEQRNLIDEIDLLMNALRQGYAGKTVSFLDKENNDIKTLLLNLHRNKFPDLYKSENIDIPLSDPVITLLSEGLKKLELHTILIDYKNHGISEITGILNNFKNKFDVQEFIDDLTPIALDNNLVDSTRARVIEKLNLLELDQMQMHFIDSISSNTYPEGAIARLAPIIGFDGFSDEFRLKALKKLMQFDSEAVSNFFHDIIYKLADEKAYNDFLVKAIIEEIEGVSTAQNKLNPDWAYVLQTVLLVPFMNANVQENAIKILAEYNTNESNNILKNIQNTISKNGNDQKYASTIQNAVANALKNIETNSTSSPIQSNIIKLNENPGGIDLNPALMDLEIRRDGNGIPLPLNLQPMEIMQIEGFVPVIINVTPVMNLPMLLGLITSDIDKSYDTSNTPSTDESQQLGIVDKYRNEYFQEHSGKDVYAYSRIPAN